MSSDYKDVKIRLPKKLWERFYRTFPARGERQGLLRKLVVLLIERSQDKDGFLDKVIEGLKDE